MNTLKANKPERWLITGGCGFIGARLIKRLKLNESISIRVLDNLSVGTADDLSNVCEFIETPIEDVSNEWPVKNSAVELIVGDICNQQICLRCCDGADVIVHLAANTGVEPSVKNPRLDLEANVFGIFNMLEAARANNAKRFVFASSGAPIGECRPPIHEEMAAHPVSPYGASKLAGEGYCSAYYRTFGLETIALRFGNVYGPGSGHKTSVVAKFITQTLMGETCVIYGDGSQTRDFIYIDDLVDSICLAAVSEDAGGQVFQIASSTERTVNEAAETIRSIFDSNYNVTMQIAYGKARLGDVQRNFSDTTKAKKILKWEAKTEFENGIKATIDWFLKKTCKHQITASVI